MKGRKEFTAKARSCQAAYTLTEIGGQESLPTRSQTPLLLSNLDINQERKRGKKVRLSCLCPGPVDTEFDKVANVKFSLSSLKSDYVAEYAIKKAPPPKVDTRVGNIQMLPIPTAEPMHDSTNPHREEKESRLLFTISLLKK